MPLTAVPLATPTIRLLPPEEYGRLSAFEPFNTAGLPDPDHWRILVAEVDDEIVAFNCLFDAVHMEPLWVHPDYRARPHAFYELLTHLWAETRGILQDAGVSFIFAVVADDRGVKGKNFVKHLGFVPAEGALFVISVDGIRLPDTSA